MRTQILKFIAMLFSLAAMSAHAIFPDSGWYWNANQSGRGFNLEIQNNLLFVSAFAYTSGGQPVWYVSGGPMSSDRSYSGTLSLTNGGQCFGCTYRGPAFTNAGSISINFTDETHAVISLLGETISVQRQDFSNYTISPDGLFGEWSITTGEPSFPVYFGDRLSFTGPAPTDVTNALGARTGSSSNIVLGIYNSSLGMWLMLVDSSTSYYQAYAFRFTGLNRLEGQQWTYLKTDKLSGSGLYFVAHRTKSQARVKGGSAPGVTKSSPLMSIHTKLSVPAINVDEINRIRATQSSVGATPIDPTLFADFETRLRAAQAQVILE